MQLHDHCNSFYWLRKKIGVALFTMKLLLLLTGIACLQAAANGYSQTVNLDFKDAQLETVLKEIKKQTGYRFVYIKEEVKSAGTVTIQVKNVLLHYALKICLHQKHLTYQVEDTYIVIKTISNTTDSIPASLEIRGKIIKETGDPLINATLVSKRTGISVVTDSKGEFLMSGITENDFLLITSVEIEPTEVSTRGKTYILVTVKQKVNTLEETIVKGYYTTTRRLNTGSVSKVISAEISKQPVSNPLATIQGRASGLFITQGNGLPGANFNVLIRGRNSIQQGTEPLYIIDGVPFPSQKFTQRSQINANSPFNTINPLDIESIEILKDADATAIYGSRGANGVIVITTKKASQNKTNISVSISSGIGKVTRGYKYLNTQQYLAMRHEAFENDGIVPDASNAPDLTLWDTTRYTDWKKELIGGTAKTTTTQLSLSCGTDKTKLSFAANYFDETTVFQKELGNTRFSGTLNANHHSINDRFRFNIDVVYATDKSNLLKQDLTAFVNLPPNLPNLYDSAGKLKWSENGGNFFNPFSFLYQKYDGTTDRFSSNAVITAEILPKLFLKSSVGYNHVEFNEYSNQPLLSQDPSFANASASFGKTSAKTWIVEPQLEYSMEIKKKNFLTILAGASWQVSNARSSLTDASGYPNDYTLESTAGASVIKSLATNSQYHYSALFTRMNFRRDNKYLINLTARRDGSSRFGPDKRLANFGAIGIGWIFSKEKIIARALPFISFGKFRTSFGVTGNDQIGAYQYLDSWISTQYPYQGQPGYRPSRLFNPNYSWEQNSKLDLALELGVLRDRILVTANWFLSRSQNQIINFSLPDQTGFSSVLKNFPGVVQNKGWEFELLSKNIANKTFNWTTNFNLTIPKNKLIAFPGLEYSSYANSYIIGQPLNIVQGFRYSGIDQSTGIYQFIDINGNQTSAPSQVADFYLLGTTNPILYGGLLNSLQIKNFQIDLFVQFVNQKGIDGVYSAGAGNGDLANQPVQLLNRWRKFGEKAPYQRYTQDMAGNAFAAAYYISISDATLVDASYMRLKNLALSYHLPEIMLKKKGIKNCRIFLQAQNIFTVTQYKGIDPENQSRTALPPIKNIVVGLHVSL